MVLARLQIIFITGISVLIDDASFNSIVQTEWEPGPTNRFLSQPIVNASDSGNTSGKLLLLLTYLADVYPSSYGTHSSSWLWNRGLSIRGFRISKRQQSA